MNKIEQALLNADDLAISEEVDCSDVLGYINDLKEQVRKETAKEIFEELRANEEENYEYCDCWLVAVEGEKFIKIAKKYGFEVDE